MDSDNLMKTSVSFARVVSGSGKSPSPDSKKQTWEVVLMAEGRTENRDVGEETRKDEGETASWKASCKTVA